jgi:hypothetical protein
VKVSMRNVGLGLLAVMLGALPAYAQDAPKVEGTLGYQAINARTGKAATGENAWYSIGFNIDGAWSLGSRLAVLGELGWGRSPVEGTCTVCTAPIPIHEQTRAAFNETNIGGGLRYNLGGNAGKFTPFVQAVVGVSRDSFDTRTALLFAELVGEAYTTNSFMAQPGAGVVYRMNQNIGIVGQVDYRRVFAEDEGFNAFRIVAGMRFFGK